MELGVFVILAIVLTFCYLLIASNGSKKSFPVPRGYPIVGHFFLLGSSPEKTFLRWKSEYGPVFMLNLLGKRVLVLNDRKSITECFTRQEFSGRLAVTLWRWWRERSGGGLAFNEGPHVEEQRQFFLKAFRDHGMQKNKMEDHFQREIEEFLTTWECNQGQFFELSDAFPQLALNCVWRVFANKRFDYQESRDILKKLKIAIDEDSLLSKLATFIPGVVNLVSNAAKTKDDMWYELTLMQQPCVEEHQKTRIPGQPRDIVDKFLDQVDSTSESDSIFHPSQNAIGPALRDIMGATMDTTTATLEWFVVYCLYFPHITKRFFEEIDNVIGSHRKPTLADKDKMPYTIACILETLRYSSVSTFGVPHSALQDAEFRGISISRGTLILSNLYAVHHDAEVWKNPEDFHPQRFLTDDGSLVNGAWNKILPFGAGKRSCIGFAIVEDEMFLIVTSIFQNFRIKTFEPILNVDGVQGIANRPCSGIKISVEQRLKDNFSAE